MKPAARDRAIETRLARWFAASARDLPWRADVAHPRTAHAGGRDPYAALVSEFMLQQTQVSRVLERYGPFLESFPTVRHLAAAPEQEVMAHWQGMGYYRRARMLHAAARAVVEHHDGHVPAHADALRELPGVGPYTAGALASIVFGERCPTVDGNIARVLVRVEGREVREDARARDAWAWSRAESLVRGSRNAGVLNEALMELGATVCTPAAPRCPDCPLRSLCEARRRGIQTQIPPPKDRGVRQRIFHNVVLVRREDGAVLIEERPHKGLWAGMWQAPTLEHDERAATARELA
ncbi:MAG: A/G-specific adenine glycosylase, partial [Planctomycetota bacterium]|nr:A/G-specific adenine glycosylase [Planctomycetota bacterium]